MQFLKLLKSYKWWAIIVTILGLAANGLSLYVPKLSAKIIDTSATAALQGNFYWSPTMSLFLFLIVFTLIIAVVQIYISTYFSEKVALDLRHNLIEKISGQSFHYISSSTPGRLLTILTSDIDAVKDVISQGLVTLLGAFITLIGAAILLLTINLKLALYTLSVIPFLLLTFIIIFGSLASLFQRGQENLEKINALINESIVGAALVRVLNSARDELKKFLFINTLSKDTGIGIVKNFSALIPIITLLANASTIIIIWFGGGAVIGGTLSVGNFSAFIMYSAMFIWPLFVMSFVGMGISRGFVSLKRINEVIDSKVLVEKGERVGKLKGDIEFKNVSLSYTDEGGTEKRVLKDISFIIKAKTKTAIVGPTAAGKTQLFYLMSGLVLPTSGEILIDGNPMSSYKTSDLLTHIGLVFQDSIVFNTSFRENIAFSLKTTNESLEKALKTSELEGLVARLPMGLDTHVSERGTSLSGGQKQRLMLARALAVDPQILLLDDFTAQVDQATEVSILKNVADNYPGVTLVSITQKVEPIKHYDRIIVLMEGELVATGKHDDLLKNSFEYKQIYQSQMSTETLAETTEAKEPPAEALADKNKTHE